MNDESELKTYCIGVVAIDKEPGSDKIMVYPSEPLAFEEGKVDEIYEKKEATIPDIKGVAYTAKADRTAMFEARWFHDGDDGRQTPPDVVNGETVRIYRFADSEIFYWKTIFREPKIRRLEHVVHAYCDLKSGRNIFGLDSSYGNLWSTRDKIIDMWTAQSNGEAFKYNFTINTKENTVRLKDNIGNEFGINSDDNEIYIKNANGTIVDLKGNDIIISAPATITETAPTKTLNASSGVSVNTPEMSVSGEVNASALIVRGGGAGSRQAGASFPIEIREMVISLQTQIEDLKECVRRLGESPSVDPYY